MMRKLFIAISLLASSMTVEQVNGHGNLVTPTPRQITNAATSPYGSGDVQSLSGGGPTMDRANGHGLCGDTYDRRTFMSPSINGATDPVAEYTQGQAFDLTFRITAHHWGWVEVRLCRPQDGGVDQSVPITQDCLNEHVLKFDLEYVRNSYQSQMEEGFSSPADYEGPADNRRHQHTKCEFIPDSGPVGSCCRDGGTCSDPAENDDRWVLPSPSGGNDFFTVRYILPADVTCERCVLQWYYQTGNSQDAYPEAFWNCADIKIVNGNPGQPTEQPTTAPPTTASPTNAPEPTAPPTPEPTVQPGQRCISSGDPRASDEWCETVNCDPVYVPEFCVWANGEPTEQPTPDPMGPEPTNQPTTTPPPTNQPTTTPPTNQPTTVPPTNEPTTAPPTTASPTDERGQRCISSGDPRASDEWCEQVNCDPVYVPEFCVWANGEPTEQPTSDPMGPNPTAEPTPLVNEPEPTVQPTPLPVGDPEITPSYPLNIIGYHGNSGNALAFIPRLTEVACFYNIIILTFANFNEEGELLFEFSGPYVGNLDLLRQDILTWKAAGDPYGREKKVLFSIGGQNGEWPNGLTGSEVQASIDEFIESYHLDGLDIDLEGSAVNEASTLASVVTNLRARNLIVSAAPEAAQGPLTGYAEIIPLLDYLTPQFYNNGPNAVTTPFTPTLVGAWTSPPNHWQDSTPNAYEGSEKSWWLNVLDTTSAYYGLSANQRGMLIPATLDAAGNNNDWDIDLLKTQIATANIQHVGSWAIAYDNRENWVFSRTMASIMSDEIPANCY